MSRAQKVFKGVIHGNTITLEQEPGLPDGHELTVTLQPVAEPNPLPPSEGIRQSAGAWADDPDGLDKWLTEMQRSRQGPDERLTAR